MEVEYNFVGIVAFSAGKSAKMERSYWLIPTSSFEITYDSSCFYSMDISIETFLTSNFPPIAGGRTPQKS